jgi:hypothetical protein
VQHHAFAQAMLLRTDFDHAKTRRHLFGESTSFAKKLVLTKRIRWIEGSTGSPSFNHSWMIWDKQHYGAPSIAYVDRGLRSAPIDLCRAHVASGHLTNQEPLKQKRASRSKAAHLARSSSSSGVHPGFPLRALK